MNKLQIEYISIDKLKKLPKNPKTHDIVSLKSSFDEFGFRDAIKVNRMTEHIEAGNGRLETLLQKKKEGKSPPNFIIQENGKWLAPVIFFEDDEKTERRYALADNRLQELGGYNEPLLLENLLDLKENLDATGYSLTDIDLLNEKIESKEDYKYNEKDDQVPDVKEKAISKLGDLWILGRHRLLCGDATKREDVERLMERKKAFLLATDPPYGVNKDTTKYNPKAKKWDHMQNDELQSNQLTIWLKNAIEIWLDYIDKRAGFYLWTAAMAEGAAAAAAIKKAGIHIQSQIIWVKNSLVLGQADYQWKHENCWYGFLKGEKHFWYGGRDQTTTWEIKREFNNIHPTQKPVELFIKPILNHTQKNEKCLEPFTGSGTQFIACEKTNRICYGMEIEPLYVDVTIRRWQNYTEQEAIRENGTKFNDLVDK